MLVQRKTTPYICILKTLSGEEFICKVIDETENCYTVSKPLTVMNTPQGPRFVPILMLADPDKHVTVPKPVIVGTPATEIESQYESLTTGIALPQKSSIITS